MTCAEKDKLLDEVRDELELLASDLEITANFQNCLYSEYNVQKPEPIKAEWLYQRQLTMGAVLEDRLAAEVEKARKLVEKMFKAI